MAETSRATHEIQCDAMKLVRKLEGAIDAANWPSVFAIAQQFEEIVQRGLHHAAKEKAKDAAAFAMRNYQTEPEAR